jgi:hypothetical protein
MRDNEGATWKEPRFKAAEQLSQSRGLPSWSGFVKLTLDSPCLEIFVFLFNQEKPSAHECLLDSGMLTKCLW